MVDGLRAHLKKYQLRLRAKIADVSEEYQTWHAWPGAAKSGVLEDKTGLPDILSIKDPRHNGFGWRIVGPNGKGAKQGAGLHRSKLGQCLMTIFLCST
jgi:hypothetical protein